MDKRVLKVLAPAVILVLIAFFFGSARTSKGEIAMTAQLSAEKCAKGGTCNLENHANSPMVILTSNRTLYHIELNRAPRWKLDEGFGKRVAVKGIIKGNKLLLNDLAVLEGGGKLSKACL